MIRVTIYKDGRHMYRGFDADGHSGFSAPGTDIVCAAVSALIINTINAVGKFTKDPAAVSSEAEGGKISFRFKGRPGHDSALLLDAMVLGLQAIEDNNEYGQYIDIIFEEVC